MELAYQKYKAPAGTTHSVRPIIEAPLVDEAEPIAGMQESAKSSEGGQTPTHDNLLPSNPEKE